MLDLPVPSPGPPGPYGTMAWLRATVSRFANGEAHARRRAIAEALLAELDLGELRASVDLLGLRPSEEPLAYLPVAALARATGVSGDVVDDIRTIAAAYHPGTDAPGADAALARVLAALPACEPEEAAQRVALLVQACEATAALIRGAETPVPATRRVAPDGTIVAVSLEGRPFGAGPRRCPGEAHARVLAAAVIDGARARAGAEAGR